VAKVRSDEQLNFSCSRQIMRVHQALGVAAIQLLRDLGVQRCFITDARGLQLLFSQEDS
jgi:hypothetical protein